MDEAIASTVSDTELLVELTAKIVAAYVSKHVIPASELAALIADVHTALNTTSVEVLPPAAAEKQKNRPSLCESRCRTTKSPAWNAGKGSSR